MKLFIMNIYKRDSRTKSGRRIVGSYEWERRDREAMEREVRELNPLYQAKDGYTFEILEAK